MTNRERFHAAFLRRPADRIPRCDISFWPETLARWRKEGLPENVRPADYFGLDDIRTCGFNTTLGFEPTMIEEGDGWQVVRDGNGVTKKKWTDHYGAPQELDYTLQTEADWKRLRERLVVDESRIPERLGQMCSERLEGDVFNCISPREPCWWLIETLGYDRLLMHMAGETEWVREMMTVYTDFTLGMCELCVRKGMHFDALWMFSDLCYKNGMLFSPAMFRELLMPLHKRVRHFCTDHDIRMILHCDGYVGDLMPLLIEIGYDAIQPLEARARNDVREYMKTFGDRISFFGNISADIMTTTKDAIEEEVRTKLLAAKSGGGYIYHSDHSINPGISMDNYAFVIECVKKYGEYD